MDGGAGAGENVHVRLQLQGGMHQGAKQQATKQQVDIEATRATSHLSLVSTRV